MERVHEEQVEIGRNLRKVRYYHKENKGQNHARERKDSNELAECISLVLTLPIIIEEHEARYRQQVQQVYAYRETHQEANQHNPAVRVRLVRLFIPFGHRPEHDCRKERGHRIDLTFYCGKPECVGETVCERSNGSASVYGNGSADGIFPVLTGLDDAFGEKDDGEIEKKYRQCGAYRTHRIDCHRRMHFIREHCAKTRNQLKHRVSRRMSDFKFI